MMKEIKEGDLPLFFEHSKSLVDIYSNLKNDCVMNTTTLEDDSQTFQAYKCSDCTGQENICLFCYENCHGEHTVSMAKPEGKKVFFKNASCSCAAQNHMLGANKQKETIFEVNKARRSEGTGVMVKEKQGKMSESIAEMILKRGLALNKSLKILEASTISSRTKSISHSVFVSLCGVLKLIGKEYAYCSKTGVIFCIFCIKHCQLQKNLSNFEKIENTSQSVYCHCQSLVYHGDGDKTKFFEKLLADEKILNVTIPRVQLPSKFLNDESRPPCFEEVLKMHTLYSYQIKTRGSVNIDGDALIIYDKGIKLLKMFAKVYKEDHHNIRETQPSGTFDLHTIENCFSIEFLNLIFSMKPDKNEAAMNFKRNCLKIFRKMILMPKAKHLMSRELEGYDNISPLHRTIYQKRLRDCMDLDLTENKYEDQGNNRSYIDLLNCVYKHIVKSIGYHLPKKITSGLIREFFQHLSLLHSFSDCSSMLSSHMKQVQEITQKFIFIYREEDIKVLQSTVDITFKFLLKKNDMAFITRLMTCEGSDDESTVNYCFKPSEEVQAMITARCALQELAVCRNKKGNSEIYDLLINKFDKYSETVKCLLESHDHFLNHMFIRQVQENKIGVTHFQDCMNSITDHKSEFYDNKISYSEFYEVILNDLSSLSEFILNSHDTFHFHVCFVKCGIFDQLMTLYSSLSSADNNDQHNVKIIQRKIREIFSGIRNSFFSSLLFSNSSIETIFSRDIESNNVETAIFYRELLQNLKKDNYRLDFTFFLQKLLSQLSEFDVDTNSEEDEIYYQVVFNVIKRCLSLSSNQSKEGAHNMVAYRIRNILENPNFEAILHGIANLDKTENENFLFIIFKIVNSLSDYSFSLCWAWNLTVEVEKILYGCPDLTLRQRRILNKTMSRCYLENSFRISIKPNSNRMRRLETEVWNLLSGINTETLIAKNISEIDLQHLFQIEDRDLIQYKEYGLRNVIFNLGKYPSHYFPLDFNRNELKHWKRFVKYFHESIFSQTVDALYKLAYYPPLYPLRLQYLMFIIVEMFLSCFTTFLLKCQDEITDTNRSMVTEYLSNFLQIDQMPFNIYTGVIIGHIKSALDDFSKANCFDIDKILSVWEAIARYWKPFVKSTREWEIYSREYKLEYDIIKWDKHKNNKFYTALKAVYEDYITQKADFESNVLTHLIRTDNSPLIISEEIFHQLVPYNPDAAYDDYPTLAPFHDVNYHAMERATRYFLITPENLHKIFVSSISNTGKDVVHSIVRDQLLFFLQFILIEFTKRNSRDTYAYENFINSLEFLRLLCENHNVFMQTYFMKITDMNGNDIEFNSFLYQIPKYITNHLSHWISKKNLGKVFGRPSVDYYFVPLIVYLFNFNIECIQGTLASNFRDFLFKNYEFNHFLVSIENDVLGVDYANHANREKDYYCLHVMRLINALVDDRCNVLRNRIFMNISPYKLYQVCQCFFKKMIYFQRTKSRLDTPTDTADFESLVVKEQDSKKLLNDYGLKEDFKDDIYCQISCELFYYLYYVANIELGTEEQSTPILSNNVTDAKNIILKLKYLKKKFKKKKLEGVKSEEKLEIEMSRFFNILFKTVELTFVDAYHDSDNTSKKYEVIFNEVTGSEPFPKILQMEVDSKKAEKKQQTPAEKAINEIKNEIIKKQNSTNEPFLVHFKVHPDGIFIGSSSIKRFKARVISEGGGRDQIFRHLTDTGEEGIEKTIDYRKRILGEDQRFLVFYGGLNLNDHIMYSSYLCLMVNMLILYSISVNSMGQWIIIRGISIINCSYLLFLLWGYVYLKSFIKRAFKFSYIFTSRIFPITWSLITCSLGLLTPFFFFYSIQLFSLFFVINTMKVVLTAIKLRYEQFLSATLVIIIMVLFFSLISFFFFKNEFSNPELQENKCNSIFHCFFFALNSGLRSQSVGLPMYSYQNDTTKYWIEFFFDMIFYICLIFIMLNVINGIIVDTFQELRELNIQQEKLTHDVCFICTLSRSQFEIKGKDFEAHLKKEHKVISYIQYLVRVNKENKYDLNALDTHVLECIKSKSTDIFPYQKAHSY